MDTNTDKEKKPKSAKDLLTRTANAKIKSDGSMEKLKTDELKAFIEQYKPMISQSIVKHLTPERLIQMTTNLLVKNPKLMKCTPQSLVSAVMQASELGFKPVQALGECYFVPYKNQIQFQIGYKGYISLARRSGEIKTIHAYCVYEGDGFTYELGLNPVLKHKPSGDDRPFTSITHAYAVAHYKDGGYNFYVISRSQIEKLRTRNSSQNEWVDKVKKPKSPSGVWETDYDKMACAKAIKQLSKYMPLSDEMRKAITMDESIPNIGQFRSKGTDLDALTYDVEDIAHEEINE